MALIFFVSSQPSAPLPESVSDKGAHLLAYSVLGVLSVRAAGGGLPCRVTVPIALTALAITSGYGALDEWRQGVVPGRSQDIADWYADTAGAVIGIGVCWAWGMMRALGRRSP
ncbi:MAG TPA: VanZ family protein [Vicinamibacterales bacterium]|nr:VanZ family protein [Vicinamibacterales bacterium]